MQLGNTLHFTTWVLIEEMKVIRSSKGLK